MRGAARRIALVLSFTVGITALGSLLVGLLAGSSPTRAVSTGFYLVGCFLIVLGVFSGIRGPIRARGRDDEERPLSAFFSSGIWAGVRSATSDERSDALATAWLFLLLGVVLVLAGVLVDSRVGFA